MEELITAKKCVKKLSQLEDLLDKEVENITNWSSSDSVIYKFLGLVSDCIDSHYHFPLSEVARFGNLYNRFLIHTKELLRQRLISKDYFNKLSFYSTKVIKIVNDRINFLISEIKINSTLY